MIIYLESLVACTELDSAWKIYCEKMAEYGFDRVIYAYSRYCTGDTTGHHEDALVLSNHKKEYFSGYMDAGHYRQGPISKWALDNIGAMSWNIIEKNYKMMTEGERKVVDYNRSFDVISGYTVSFARTSSRTRGIAALCARKSISQDQVDEIWHLHGRDIELMCNVAHLKFISLPHIGFFPTLSPRQLEALEWVGDGKTNQDIAIIMGISPATVEKHLRLAREKMNVETTTQAILKATFQNQMYTISL